MMNPPQQYPLAQRSAGCAPPRVPGSIRRTTSIDSYWPDGQNAPWRMIGQARDLLTPLVGEPVELASSRFSLLSSPAREIMELETSPFHPRAGELAGVRASFASRTAISEKLGDLRGTPLFQLLDDFAGAGLVASWIWSRWSGDWNERLKRDMDMERRARMVDICTGFANGASSLAESGTVDASHASSTAVEQLENADDPLSWHAMPRQRGPQMRRARRIDLWHDGTLIKVDASFQDSGSTPNGGRFAIHEYRVHAEIDRVSGVLVALQALPLILPFRECPGAAVKATRMIGQRIAEFRTAVIETLPSTLGCTHLNDVMRALADVPVLAELLRPNNE